MEKDTFITKVIFRIYPSKNIIAIFPEELGDSEIYNCLSYVHMGQHSSCNPSLVINNTKLAKPEEYKDLLEELENLGYNLMVCKKYQSNALAIRKREMKKISFNNLTNNF